MQNFFDWIQADKTDNAKPWLVLGKGPSFSKVNQYDLSNFNTIALNHVVREVKVDIAHIIDFNVFDDCWESIQENSKFLLLPWVPHLNNEPSDKTLEILITENNKLAALKEEGRLLWYNLSTAAQFNREVRGDYPIVPVTFYSAEAVIRLLAMTEVKCIRSLGVDGGNTYSVRFDDLKDKTLLNNGHHSFDIQFKNIMETVDQYQVDFKPLDVETPIKIYVGSMPEQMLSVKVLEYSVKKYCPVEVEVIPLFANNIKIPFPKDKKNQPRTPFSFQRFLIPQLNGFKGKAIYVDSDMQVFSNIVQLWNVPFNGAGLLAAYEVSDTGRKPQFSVMLLDCKALHWKIEDIVKKLDDGELNYETLMYEMKVAKEIAAVIPGEWNSLEYYNEKETCLLHYTDMHRQPWLFKNNENGYLWVKALHEAIQKGFISLDDVKSEMKKGNIRPSLLWQLANTKFNCVGLPKVTDKMDRFFVPPHLRNQKTKRLTLTLNNIMSSFLSIYYKD